MWYGSVMRLTADQWMAKLPFDEIYRVGGSVRDELLGREAKDSDYMVRNVQLRDLRKTLASKGAEISRLRLRGSDGPEIGVRALVPGLGTLEVVLPRAETSTGAGRHDFDIVVDPALPVAADAVRRDFTINSIYKNVRTQEIIDPFGGAVDIENGWITTTHPDSFRDDPLRMLRALRFVSTLGFKLHGRTQFEMRRHAEAMTGLTVKGVSATALDELSKLLMGSNPSVALRIGFELGPLRVLLPELVPMLGFEQRSRYHEKTTSEHTFDAVQAAANMHESAPLSVRLALLFHDCGKPKMAWIDEDGRQHYYALTAKKAIELGAPVAALYPHEYWSAQYAASALNRLGSPKQLRKEVVTLIEHHMLTLHENIRPFKVRQWRAELGDDMLTKLITHRLADVLGKGGDVVDAVATLLWVREQQERAIRDEVPAHVTELAIDGRDLLDIGYTGPGIGIVQKQLLHEVLAQPKLNNREWLFARAAKLKDALIIKADQTKIAEGAITSEKLKGTL